MIDQEGQDLETCLQAVLETLEKQKVTVEAEERAEAGTDT